MIIDVPAPVARSFAAPAATVAPPRLRRVVLNIACITYLAALIAVWLYLRQAGDRSWFPTLLLMGPRWPYLLPLAILWPSVLWRRRWLPACIALAATWLAVTQLVGARLNFWSAGPAQGDLRLLTCNIHRQQLDGSQLIAFVEKSNPDIVALQGWSGAHDSLFSAPTWHTRREGELFIASRRPITRVTPLTLAEPDDVPTGERGSAAIFELETTHGPITVINLHLASPHAGLNAVTTDSGAKLSAAARRRWRESETLRVIAGAVQGPLLLAGDFNTVDDSPVFREYWSDFADAFQERGLGTGYTYLNSHTQLRIDHVLAGEEWRIVGWSLGPDVGSPHRPLVADLSLR